MPVDAILSDPPKWSLLINDTDPIFFYCGAPNSCIGFQMVGVINPNASVSLGVQKQYAANSTIMLLPGEDWPDEGPANPFTTTTTATATTTSTSSPSSTNVPPTTTATPEPSSSGHKSLSAGAIAGIAIGKLLPITIHSIYTFHFTNPNQEQQLESSPWQHSYSSVAANRAVGHNIPRPLRDP